MKGKYAYVFFILLIISCLYMPANSTAAEMSDYAVYPPFISTSTTPNLLLIIDNSGSMYDLAYIDEGNSPTRDPNYCYDQTYASTNTYTGYFEKDDIYSYNLIDERFVTTAAFPATCTHEFSGQLCVNIVGGTVTEFSAKGNYLNWLTASKLDVQKKILTGGKYNPATKEFNAETRGCMGRRYLKEPLTADYVEGGTNTSLGITIAITGPANEYNTAGVSNGGQAYIQVFEGNYNETLCQAAIEAVINHSNPSSIRTTVEDCLSYDAHAGGSQYCFTAPAVSCTVDSDCDNVGVVGDCSTGNPATRTCIGTSDPSMLGLSCTNDADCDTISSTTGPCVGGTASAANRTKIIFASSMQECWQIWDGKTTEASHDAWSADAPKCADIYAGYKACTGGTNDGVECATSAECTGGGTCTVGPDAITAGNAGLLCSSNYAGYCATPDDPAWAGTTWAAKEYTDAEECFLTMYTKFCNGVNVPTVIDPSDAPSNTAEYSNVPAIISDIGVEAQLGSPLLELTAKKI